MQIELDDKSAIELTAVLSAIIDSLREGSRGKTEEYYKCFECLERLRSAIREKVFEMDDEKRSLLYQGLMKEKHDKRYGIQ